LKIKSNLEQRVSAESTFKKSIENIFIEKKNIVLHSTGPGPFPFIPDPSFQFEITKYPKRLA